MLGMKLMIEDIEDWWMHADIMSEKELSGADQTKLEDGDLGIICVDEGRASDFLRTISTYEICGTELEHALSKLVVTAYKLGFQHGTHGLPQNVLEYENDEETRYTVKHCGTAKDFILKKG